MRPCLSSNAPAMGLIRSPGKTLMNVTSPAKAGDPYRSRVNRTIATLTIDCATRAICIEMSTRPRVGTRSSAR